MDIENINNVSTLILRYKDEIKQLNELEDAKEVSLSKTAEFGGSYRIVRLGDGEFSKIKALLLNNRNQAISNLEKELSEELKK